MSQYASREDQARAEERDRGGWIQTYSGGRFFYDDPRPEDVRLVDIAHALSNLCRYAGHGRFYSVAEHSVIMSRQFTDKKLRLIALLHDATEAYCADIPRPLKRKLPDYTRYEDSIWQVIAERFGLPAEIPAEIHELDTRMLMTERPFLFAKVLPWPKYADVQPIPGVQLYLWPPMLAEARFLQTWLEIRSAAAE